MNDRQSQSNKDQQNPQQQNNPEKLAATDEQQRLQRDQNSGTNQKVPVGNERDEETEGSQAGMGE
jgi:hypothetical protein